MEDGLATKKETPRNPGVIRLFLIVDYPTTLYTFVNANESPENDKNLVYIN